MFATDSIEAALELALLLSSAIGVAASASLVHKARLRLRRWDDDLGRVGMIAKGRCEHETYRLIKQVLMLGGALYGGLSGPVVLTHEGIVWRVLLLVISLLMVHTSVRGEIVDRQLVAFDAGVETADVAHDVAVDRLITQATLTALRLKEEAQVVAAQLEERATNEMDRLFASIREIRRELHDLNQKIGDRP